MGRFDQLTQLEKKAVIPPSSPKNDDTPITANQFTNKLTKKQTNKEANQQASEPTNQQTNKEESKQASLPTNQKMSKSLKKFGSYLTEESLKRLKRIAFETDRKDYDVLQEAVDLYLEMKKNEQ